MCINQSSDCEYEKQAEENTENNNEYYTEEEYEEQLGKLTMFGYMKQMRSDVQIERKQKKTVTPTLPKMSYITP